MGQSTKRQQAAVRFCEEWLYNVEFEGDINRFEDCSVFLSEYLEDAKDAALEAQCEYETWKWESLTWMPGK